MPRLARRARGGPVAYKPSHVFQLLVGHDFFHDGFGSDTDSMREAWPVLRSATFELMETRNQKGVSRLRPWAWWQFESPEPRNESETEAVQLARMEPTRCPD